MMESADVVVPEGWMRGGLSAFAPSSFRTIRRRSKLTIDEVAVSLGVSSATVSRWESGVATPRPDHLLALAELFGRPTSEFLRLPAEPTLRHLREMAGLTGAEVAAAAGKNSATVSRIEIGAIQPNSEVAAVMARLYGVSEREIFETWQRDVERVRERAHRAAHKR